MNVLCVCACECVCVCVMCICHGVGGVQSKLAGISSFLLQFPGGQTEVQS